MDKIDIIKRIMEDKLVAVIRAESKEQGLKVVDAVQKGGIKLIEVTMTVPGAVDIINSLTQEYKGKDVVIGAGTVLDSETARMCILAGAQFVVSPSFNEGTSTLCNRYRIPYLPGAMTVNEIIECLEHGADIIKLFPGNLYHPGTIKDFKAPLPQANFMPTGGVSVDNIAQWIKAGAVAIGVGGSLTAGAKTGDYDAVTREAERFIEALNQK